MKKNLIFYVGYSEFDKPYGSELALVNLAKQLLQYYNVYIFGKSVVDNVTDGVGFYNSNKLEKYLDCNDVDVLIISRYVHYFMEYPVRARKVFIWLHDVCYHGAWNGLWLPDNGKHMVNNLIHLIDGFVCLTQWHKELIRNHYGLSIDKIHIVGNGVCEIANDNKMLDLKVKGRFIYTSDVCRGLVQLVNYFHDIHKEYPDTELWVYRDKGSFRGYEWLLDEIEKCEYIHFGGRLEQHDLMKEFAKADIWLYPTTFPETFCMSALEAMRMGCYCIASNIAGLANTIVGHGVLIDGDPKNDETKRQFIDAVRLAMTNEQFKWDKQMKAIEWAREQTWGNRAKEWLKLFY